MPEPGTVPGLLDVLDQSAKSRARKLAAFVLGEVASTDIEVVDALGEQQRPC